MYMQYLPLLERLFPDALYVHLSATAGMRRVSFLAMPAGIVTEDVGASAVGRRVRLPVAARRWRAARALARRVGRKRYRELRYEALAADPERRCARSASSPGSTYEPAMLEYAGHVDLSGKPHQKSLERPPTPGIRDWRTDMEHRESRHSSRSPATARRARLPAG